MDKPKGIAFDLSTGQELSWQDEVVLSIPGCSIAKRYEQMEKNGTQSTACLVEHRGMQVEVAVSWIRRQQRYCLMMSDFEPSKNGPLFDLIERRCRALGLAEVRAPGERIRDADSEKQ